MFHHCQSEEEAKKLYRRLVKRLHPDHGSEHALMVLLQESYDIALNRIKNPTSSPRSHNAGGVTPPPQSPTPTSFEKVFINDRRLDFVKELRKLLKRLKPNNPVFSVVQHLDDNQFLTIDQYNWLKSIWLEATRPR